MIIRVIAETALVTATRLRRDTPQVRGWMRCLARAGAAPVVTRERTRAYLPIRAGRLRTERAHRMTPGECATRARSAHRCASAARCIGRLPQPGGGSRSCCVEQESVLQWQSTGPQVSTIDPTKLH
jgi:hypothetical protein